MMSRGFTLIELLVAVSIIAVLSAVGFTYFGSVKEKAWDGIRKRDLQTLATALELYFQTKDEYVINEGSCTKETADSNLYSDRDFANLISGNLPKDPKNNNPYCYESADGLTYKLYARLEDGSDYILTSEDYIALAASPTPTATPQMIAPKVGKPQSSTTPTPTPTLPTLRIFVTGSTYTGDLGGVNGADQKCQSASNKNTSLKNSLWRAWISDSTVNAKDRISDGKYTLINGTVIANNKTDLLDGSLVTPINLTEDNKSPSIYNNENFPYVWTGTDLSGNKTINTCAGWDKPETANGTVGIIGTGRDWTGGGDGIAQCQSYKRHLYCFEQPTASSSGGTGCLTAYQDFDNDGYTLNKPVYFCSTATLPYGYKSSPSASVDCYDQNLNVHPGQTEYFTTNRGDGSFDYNCSGAGQPQYSYWGSTCGAAQVSTTASQTNCSISWRCTDIGANTTAADCGISGSFLDNQQPDFYQCDEGGAIPVYSPERITLACR